MTGLTSSPLQVPAVQAAEEERAALTASPDPARRPGVPARAQAAAVHARAGLPVTIRHTQILDGGIPALLPGSAGALPGQYPGAAEAHGGTRLPGIGSGAAGSFPASGCGVPASWAARCATAFVTAMAAA